MDLEQHILWTGSKGETYKTGERTITSSDATGFDAFATASITGATSLAIGSADADPGFTGYGSTDSALALDAFFFFPSHTSSAHQHLVVEA